MLSTVTGVFYAKLRSLLTVIVQSALFGDVQALAYRVDFHPWGLPRAIVLFALEFRVPAMMIDEVVSAEVPCPVRHPALYGTVSRFMIHDPCEHRPHAQCRVGRSKGTCFRGFPQPIMPVTRVDAEHHTYYRRRERFSVERNGTVISDQWIVPYNRLLLVMFDCHLNVELSARRAGEYWYRAELALLLR